MKRHLLLFTLPFFLATIAFSQGEDCSTSITATADSNNEYTFAQYTYQWYSYTATMDGKIVLENLATDAYAWVQVNTDCDNYITDGYNSITFECTTGTTYYIFWYNLNSGNFYWSLAEEDAQEGEFCSSPIAATTNSNNEHTLGQNVSQWYSYTATQDGKMVLQNLAEDAYSYVNIYTDCNNYYVAYDYNEVTFEITSGVTYYIQWFNYNSTNFYWSLSEQDLKEGEACSVPMPATADSNNEHTLGEGADQWYTYTATMDGKIVLNNLATDASSYVQVSTSCNGYATFYGELATSFECVTGQTFYILWHNYNSTNFYWSLSEEALEPGDACSMPITATADSNNEHTFGQYYEQWYSYTATMDGKIELENLATDANSYVDVYSSCNNYFTGGDNNLRFECTSGQTYYIAWYNNNSTNFYWSLSEEELEAGDACSIPMPASADSNNEHTYGQYMSQWYSYTATQTGKIVLENLATDPYAYVFIYSDCNSSPYIYGYNTITFESTVGQTYYIEWYNDSSTDFFWSLTEGNIQAGDVCSMPIAATADSNNEHTFGQYISQWYSYTTTQDGKLVLKSLGETGTSYVEIYSDCDGYEEYYGTNGVSFEITSGTTYYIRWLNVTAANFFWSLSEEDLVAGEACSMPIEAVLGNNIADNSNSDQWFSYTPTENVNLVISTCNTATVDTYVEVYTDCGYAYDYYSDDDCNSQSYLTFNAEANATYFIRWRNYYTTSSFTWNLSIDEASGIDAENEYDSKVKVYPNPTSETVFIESELPIEYVRILNMQGNMVNEVSGPDSRMSINLSGGLYIVEVYFKDGGKAIKKLIVK